MNVFLLLLSTVCCFAQEPLRFKRIAHDNGISITAIQSFHQDAAGYMWMASALSDLARFDGTNFRYYSFADFESDTFSNGRGTLIFEDSKQQLWVGTDAGSLFLYDRIKDRFTLTNDSTQSPKARIYCFAEAPDGSFWLGSLGGGLIRFHPQTKRYIQYKAERGNVNSLPDNFVSGLAYDDAGLLWVSTTGGLCSFDSKTEQFTTYPLSNVNPEDTYRYRVIRNLYLKDDKIYLCTYGGLQIFDRITKTSEHYIHNPNNQNLLSHNSLFQITEDAAGKFWIASYGGGLNQFDPETKKFSHWKSEALNAESISSNNLFAVYIDESGLLWIGSADNTVSIHDTRGKKFYKLNHQADGISTGWVRGFLQENDSVFWLGFNGQGLQKLNLNSGKADKYVFDSNDKNSLGYNMVSGLSKDAEGNVWIALEGGGINKFDVKTKKFTRYLAGKNSLNNNAISALLVDDENLLWATAYRDGLTIYDINRDRFRQINNDSLRIKSGIALDNVQDIYQLNGNIWFNAQNQIIVYDKKYNRFVKVAETGRVIQVNNPFFLEMQPYSKTEMLLLTKNEARAIHYINPDSIVFKSRIKMNSPEGVKSFIVHKDEVWYITSTQLIRWNPTLNKKDYYNRSNGISGNELNSIHKDKQGRIFVTTPLGLTWFYPDQIITDTTARNILLTDFKLFNHSATLQPDSVYQFSISSQPSQLKSVTLNHNHSFFSIEYSAIEFMAPERIQYAYRLAGFDKDWVHAGNRTFASYTNLDPGQYTFEVKAANPDGYWSNHTTKLDLIIKPPFWRSAWFIALSTFVLGAMLYSIHRYRLSQSLKLERLRTKIASDLHDEVGSSLTKISIYSELAQSELTEKEKAGYLNSIGSLSREVVSTMSDIVWSIDNNNDSLHELINRMKDFATEVLEAKGIDFEFTLYKAEANKILEPTVRQSIYLIFKEAINNAIKHAQASRVKVSITTHPQFELRIEDNGVGIPEQPAQTGNGLRNMKRRAESIGGTLSFAASAGTTINLIVR